jgi:predicted solute-binding protein
MQVVGEESGGMTQGKSYGPLRVDVEQSHPISEMTIAHYDRITTSAKTIRRFWMRLRTIPPIPFLIWVVDPVETSAILIHWATTL